MNLSCSKSEQEHIAECLGDSAFTQLKHNADAADPKKIDFSITYTGNRTLSFVKWNFGDGKTASGTSFFNVYAQDGKFEVIADLTTTVHLLTSAAM